MSAYSVRHHLRAHVLGITDALCNVNRVVSCDRVALSPYGELMGAPLGVWGIAYFLALAVLLSVRAGYPGRRREVETLLLALTLGGALGAAGLALVASVLLHAICLVCTSVHLVTWAQTALVLRAIGIRGLVARAGALFHPRTAASTLACLAPALATGALLLAAWHAVRPAWEGKLIAETYRSAAELYRGGLSAVLETRYVPLPATVSDIAIGPPDAAVTLTELVDFTCPVCDLLSGTLRKLQRQFPDDLRIVLKHSPLESICHEGLQVTLHDHACFAARIAHCVAKQGRFWEMYGKLFALEYYSPKSVYRALETMGIDSSRAEKCQDAPETIAKIREDTRLATRLKSFATPTIYLNGRRFVAPLTLANLEAGIRLVRRDVLSNAWPERGRPTRAHAGSRP